MEKKRISIQKEEGYFLGINQEGERVYLMLPKFDCGWYWGCGYISTYRGITNTESNFSRHTHFKGYIIGQQEHHLNEVLKESVLNENESWTLSELINTMELLKEMLEFYNRGGVHITENPLKDLFKNENKYKNICEELLPKVFVEIDRILKGTKDKLIEEDYFKKLVVYS